MNVVMHTNLAPGKVASRLRAETSDGSDCTLSDVFWPIMAWDKRKPVFGRMTGSSVWLTKRRGHPDLSIGAVFRGELQPESDGSGTRIVADCGLPSDARVFQFMWYALIVLMSLPLVRPLATDLVHRIKAGDFVFLLFPLLFALAWAADKLFRKREQAYLIRFVERVAEARVVEPTN